MTLLTLDVAFLLLLGFGRGLFEGGVSGGVVSQSSVSSIAGDCTKQQSCGRRQNLRLCEPVKCDRRLIHRFWGLGRLILCFEICNMFGCFKGELCRLSM